MCVIRGKGGVVRSVLKHDLDDGSESLLAELSQTDRLPCVALFPSPSAHPLPSRQTPLLEPEHASRRICTPAPAGRAREEEKG